MAFLYLEHNRSNGLNRTIMLSFFFLFFNVTRTKIQIVRLLPNHDQTYKKLDQVKNISFTSHGNPVVSLVQ